MSMVDTLGLPTIFFTHSAADLQWPELARLICPDDPESQSSRTKATIENPAMADWYFYHSLVKPFMWASWMLLATGCGLNGNTVVVLMYIIWHGYQNAPDVEKLLSPSDNSDAAKEVITQYADSMVSTLNPGVLPDGSNQADAPAPKTNLYSATRSTLRLRTLTKTWLTLLLHVNATIGVLQSTVCIPRMESRSVASVT